MKKFLLFLGGFASGVILTIVVLFFIGKASASSSSNIEGLTMFDQPGQVMDVQSYKVLQVVENGNAIATGRSDSELEMYYGIAVLLLTDEYSSYYDGKIVTAPEGKSYRQVGLYQYYTQNETLKTIPAIALYNN